MEPLKRIPSPLHWFGAKSRLASQIVEHFPPHRCYCEPFGGSAAVLLAKAPSPLEVYNDINQEVTDFFRVMREPRLFRRLHQALSLTPCSRAEFVAAKRKTDDPVENARRFMLRSRQSYLGKRREWTYSVPRANSTRSSAVQKWRKGVELLPQVHERLLDVQIECLDWRVILKRYDSPTTLFLLDPPYIPGTRVSGKYDHELTERDHRDLMTCLLGLRGMAVLCGYRHELHGRLESAGWHRVDFKTRTFASDLVAKRVESLWLSPSVLAHDYNQTGQPLSAAQRMREGAFQTHAARVATTTGRIQRTIMSLRKQGKHPTKSNVAQKLGISREHLTRKYGHLFEV
jgi:DNA adenine methylase